MEALLSEARASTLCVADKAIKFVHFYTASNVCGRSAVYVLYDGGAGCTRVAVLIAHVGVARVGLSKRSHECATK